MEENNQQNVENQQNQRVENQVENKVKCDDCGTMVKEADAIKVGDRFLCQDCYNNYYECDHCGELVHHDDSYHTDDDYTLCERCSSTYAFECDHCHQFFYDSDRHRTGDDETVCNQCLRDYYIECGLCGEYFYQDDTYYCERCDLTYCSHCEHTCLATRDVISTPIHGEKTGKYLKINRLVGVEIEVEDGDPSELYLPKECGIEEDGSLNSGGVEITTPPASLDKAEELITKTCKVLKEADYKISTRCGLHVHIDASDFREDAVKLSRVLRTVYAIEDMIFAMLPPSRWNNRYCLRLSRQYSFNDFEKMNGIQDFECKWYKTTDIEEIESQKKYKHDNKGTRYCALNLHSTMYRGTIEFRYHSGTIEEEKILRWVSFLLNIVDYAINRYDDKKVVDLFSTPLNKMKLRKMKRVFRLDKELMDYIYQRIEKFNPSIKEFKKEFNRPV